MTDLKLESGEKIIYYFQKTSLMLKRSRLT